MADDAAFAAKVRAFYEAHNPERLDLVPDFNEFKLGAGVGLRYLTSFGPIRVDVAVPLDPGPRDASFQFYAGIGQAF